MTFSDIVCIISVLTSWGYGIACALWLLWGLLNGLLKKYTELRDDMLHVMKVETRILTYQRRHREVDAILEELDRQDEERRKAVLKYWEERKPKMGEDDSHD